jgi:hypothetical protein
MGDGSLDVFRLRVLSVKAEVSPVGDGGEEEATLEPVEGLEIALPDALATPKAAVLAIMWRKIAGMAASER